MPVREFLPPGRVEKLVQPAAPACKDRHGSMTAGNEIAAHAPAARPRIAGRLAAAGREFCIVRTPPRIDRAVAKRAERARVDAAGLDAMDR